MSRAHSSKTADITILGAGIQGICCALALARQGRRVCLIDAAPEPLLRTSKTGEGKIHLGFVYAKDASLRTARLMLHAAMRFAPPSGDYMLWLPHDDSYPSDYIRQLVAALEAHPAALLAFGTISPVDETGKPLSIVLAKNDWHACINTSHSRSVHSRSAASTPANESAVENRASNDQKENSTSEEKTER